MGQTINQPINEIRVISQSVNSQVKANEIENLRERLQQEALANADLDREVSREWLEVDLEGWQRLKKTELEDGREVSTLPRIAATNPTNL